MARYFSSAGIRHFQGSTNNVALGAQFPILVIFGPSGQCAQVHQPSGVGGFRPAGNLQIQAYEQTLNQAPLKFYKNRIGISHRTEELAVGRHFFSAWQPESQDGAAKTNDLNYKPDDSDLKNSSLRVMLDGRNWIVFGFPGSDGFRLMGAFCREFPASAAFWIHSDSVGNGVTAAHGTWTGEEPIFEVDPLGRNGYKARPGEFDYITQTANVRPGADSNDQLLFGGVQYTKPNESANICDAIYFKDHIFVAWQNAVACIRPGMRGAFIFHEDAEDENVNSVNLTSSYLENVRFDFNKYNGSKSRCFAVHKGNLYMLSGDGRFYIIDFPEVRKIADLSLLGTPWSSGILGGSMSELGSVGWAGAGANRCFLASFNNQLHAFLNFQTTFRVAKPNVAGGTQGKGVFWATSFDAVNWRDRSEMLPASGIISPSGGGGFKLTPGNSMHETSWLAKINPYRFSAIQTIDGAEPNSSGFFPSGYINAPIGSTSKVDSVQISGFRQVGSLPFWSSGNMLDTPGTQFNNLGVPLEIGQVSGFLFPTFVQYPTHFSAVDPNDFSQFLSVPSGGVIVASGMGPSGYDYSGVNSYHISGFSDKDTKTLKIYFTEDFRGPASTDGFGATLYAELNESSGWKLLNYLPHSNQLNGFVPIDLYDPEITIPSGDIKNPNPFIDEVNKEVRLKYKIHDWPFWDSVNVISEFSTDEGLNWRKIKTEGSLSTGTKQSDPSGILGGPEQELVWKYTQGPNAISKNGHFPNVRIRLRAEVP